MIKRDGREMGALAFKCRMCGGELEIEENGIAKCQYCQTKQTIPKFDDERKLQMYERADHFRRNHDYDKALDIYEQILLEDPSDADTYWSIVLCRFGIDYVDDPKSHQRIPTINRIQALSVFADEDYKKAIEYSTLTQKTLYEKDAEEINRIQKEYLKISDEEEPFDIFICYKENDDTGKRTPDSVLANDLYYQLVNEGYKVFFSKITLEGKLGIAFEPYIFSALKTAKIMIVLGTRPEYFNSAWVKNEWARFLAMIKSGQNKTLIPAYKNMAPYDMPEEFAYLQALDMGKIGFAQDLLRGIKKILQGHVEEQKEIQSETIKTNNFNPSVDSLLKRVFICLEDGEFEKASEIIERVLDINTKNGNAYVGKLMVANMAKKESELVNALVPISKSPAYKRALEYCDENTSSRLKEYDKRIIEKNTEYITKVVNEYKESIENEIIGFQDKIKQINGQIDEYKKDLEYQCRKQEHIKLVDEKIVKSNTISVALAVPFFLVMMALSLKSCGAFGNDDPSIGTGFWLLVLAIWGSCFVIHVASKIFSRGIEELDPDALQVAINKENELRKLIVTTSDPIDAYEGKIAELKAKLEKADQKINLFFSDMVFQKRGQITVSDIEHLVRSDVGD